MNPLDWARKYTEKYLMRGSQTGRGYMRWWHSFSGVSAETREQRTFFVEYFVRRSSHVTVKAGVFPSADSAGAQYQVIYPISSLKSAREPLVLQIEDCFYSDTHIAGHAKAMEWKLDVHKAAACPESFWSGPVANALQLLEGFWHGEGILSFYRGYISLDGERYEVTPEDCCGYADRHWGRRASLPLLQLNACRLTSSRTGNISKHSALAVHDCRPRLLCFPLKRRLMIHLNYMGEDFEFGLLDPSPFSRCKWQKKETNKRHIWHIWAQNKAAAAKICYSSQKDEILNLNRKFPLLSGANGKGTVELYRLTPEGRQYLDTLTFQTGFWACREDPQML